jgi:Flp pilus assembly pilin Flp
MLGVVIRITIPARENDNVNRCCFERVEESTPTPGGSTQASRECNLQPEQFEWWVRWSRTTEDVCCRSSEDYSGPEKALGKVQSKEEVDAAMARANELTSQTLRYPEEALNIPEAAERILNRTWPDDKGQDIAEYAVMLAVILVIVVGTIRLIGSNANTVFSQAASSIQ